MDVFLMVRRKKTTIFLDAKENTTVNELKKMVEGITKVPPQDQMLYKDDQIMMPERVLGDYGLNCSTAKAQAPAQVGLAYKNSEERSESMSQICQGDLPVPAVKRQRVSHETGRFEVLEITPLSSPPELPDVMKPTEAQSHEQTCA